MQGFPYDDDNLVFDKKTNMYYITENCILNMGIDLRSRLSSRKAVSPELIIQQLISVVTEHIYGYIHGFSSDNEYQDRVIAECPSARSIILAALKRQVVHVLNVGDLYNSVKSEERAAAVSELAKQILGKPIVEIGYSILYTGR